MTAKESGLEIMKRIWEDYYIKQMSKSQIHMESRLSRTTINKYIKLISDNMKKLGINENDKIDARSLSILEKGQLFELPQTYITRHKRVRTDELTQLIITMLVDNKEKNLTEIHRLFLEENLDITISYSSFRRISLKNQSIK